MARKPRKFYKPHRPETRAQIAASINARNESKREAVELSRALEPASQVQHEVRVTEAQS
jgi:hypothetical protein